MKSKWLAILGIASAGVLSTQAALVMDWKGLGSINDYGVSSGGVALSGITSSSATKGTDVFGSTAVSVADFGGTGSLSVNFTAGDAFNVSGWSFTTGTNALLSSKSAAGLGVHTAIDGTTVARMRGINSDEVLVFTVDTSAFNTGGRPLQFRIAAATYPLNLYKRTGASAGVLLQSSITTNTYSDWFDVDGLQTFAVDLTSGTTAAGQLATLEFKVDAGTVVPPTGLRATTGNSLVKLDWDPELAPEFDSYKVYRSSITTNLTGSDLYTSVTTNTFTDTAVTNDATYYYAVTTVNTGSGETALSNSTVVAATPAIPVPSGLQVVSQTAGQVVLQWNASTDPMWASYKVYRTTTPGTNYAAIASGVTTAGYTDADVVINTTYYYAISHVDTLGHEGALSAAVSAVVSSGPPPANKTVTFGAGNWASQGIVSRQSKRQTAVVVQDGLTFSLTISLPTATIGITDAGELANNGRGLWGTSDEPFTFSLGVSSGGTGSTLENLAFGSITISRLNQANHYVKASDSGTTNTRTVGGSTTVTRSDLYDGPNPLTALTKDNLSSWDLTVECTGDNCGGIGALSFNYAVGGLPYVALSGPSQVYEDGAASITVSPSQPVTGLSGSSFIITNGVVAGFTDNGGTYTLLITPTGAVGQFITVTLPGGVTTPPNQASNTLQVEIISSTAFATLSTRPRPSDDDLTRTVNIVNDDKIILVDVSFTRPVTGLTSDDFVIANGIVSNFTGSGDTYTLSIKPTGIAGGFVSVQLPGGRTTPVNAMSNTLQIKIIHPTLFLDEVFSYEGRDSTSDEVEVTDDVVYGYGEALGGQHIPLHLDIFRPIDNPEHPILPAKLPVYVGVHGGGWNSGDRKTVMIRGYCEGLVTRGYVAIAIQYRLNNDDYNPLPNEGTLGPGSGDDNRCCRDMSKAIRWIRQNADSLGIDPNRMILGGNSAGAISSLTYSQANPGNVSSVTRSGDTLTQGDFKLRDWEVFNFQENVSLDVAAIHSQSGYYQGSLRAGGPPICQVHGTKDNTVPYDLLAVPLARSMENAGYPHTFLSADGEGHGGFNYFDYISHEKNGMTYEQHWVRFFFEHLNLIELLPKNSIALSVKDGTAEVSIDHDARFDSQLYSCDNLFSNWTAVVDSPIYTSNRLSVATGMVGTNGFYRWDTDFDYEEVMLSDY